MVRPGCAATGVPPDTDTGVSLLAQHSDNVDDQHRATQGVGTGGAGRGREVARRAARSDDLHLRGQQDVDGKTKADRHLAHDCSPHVQMCVNRA